jgi:hypothetical protein
LFRKLPKIAFVLTVIFGIGATAYFRFVNVISLTGQATVQLETTLIQALGIMLGFSGIIFAQLLAGFQKEQPGSEREAHISLLVRMFQYILVYFVLSIGLALWYLVQGLADPSNTIFIAFSVVLPATPTIFALLLIMGYLSAYRVKWK